MPVNHPPIPYSTESEIEAVVKGFEDCSTPKDDFTHRLHLTVGVWYLWHSENLAFEKMRDGLFHFLQHHEVPIAKYREDVTLAWLDLIKQTMAECESPVSLLEMTNHVIDRLGDSGLIKK